MGQKIYRGIPIGTPKINPEPSKVKYFHKNTEKTIKEFALDCKESGFPNQTQYTEDELNKKIKILSAQRNMIDKLRIDLREILEKLEPWEKNHVDVHAAREFLSNTHAFQIYSPGNYAFRLEFREAINRLNERLKELSKERFS